MERRTCLLAISASSALLALAGTLSGCSSSDQADIGPRAGLACVDDSSHCISQREKVFDQYMADKSRGWVKQPASPEAYASGVRLFALSKQRRDLSCDDLLHGKHEADAGPAVLRANAGGRFTPAQIARGVMLANEVSRDLGRELDKRCKKA